MNKKYLLSLTEEQRQICQKVVKKLEGNARKVRRTNILLMANVNGPAWTDKQIAADYQFTVQTVENVLKRFAMEGFELALHGKKRQSLPTARKLDGEKEAKLMALNLSQPPEGYPRWTLRLRRDKLVELKLVDSISPETIRKTLKKRRHVACGATLGDPARAERRVCSPHGECAGSLFPDVRSAASGGVHVAEIGNTERVFESKLALPGKTNGGEARPHLTTHAARTRLSWLYPKIQVG